MKINFTTYKIDRIIVKKGRKEYWDTNIPGLGLRVSAANKVFFLMYRFEGKLKRLTLGKYGTITVKQAYKIANKVLTKVSAGKDPAQKKQDRRKIVTVKELCKIYMEKHAIPFKRSYKDDEFMINSFIIPFFKNKKIDTVTRQDVITMLQKRGKNHPSGANRLHSLILCMFNLAKDWGLLNGENPANRIKRYREKKRYY